MQEPALNECTNCGQLFTGTYCNTCGQKVFSEEDKSIKKIWQEVVHFATHFESGFVYSMKTIFFKPGKMTLDYCSGVRKKYYSPVSLFMLMMFLYLIYPIAQGLNMPMETYKYSNSLGMTQSDVDAQIRRKAMQLNISEQELAERYAAKSEKISKFLILMLIPLTLLVLFLLSLRTKRRVYDLVILSAEINVFVIATYFIIMPLVLLLIARVIGLQAINPDSHPVGLLLMLTAFCAYVFVIFKRYYRLPWPVNLMRTAVFVFFYITLVHGVYRISIFELVMILL